MAVVVDKERVAGELADPTVPTSVLWSVMPSAPWVSQTIRHKDASQHLGKPGHIAIP
jgi:hypothetical protein